MQTLGCASAQSQEGNRTLKDDAKEKKDDGILGLEAH
jgi:hypothetical protein